MASSLGDQLVDMMMGLDMTPAGVLILWKRVDQGPGSGSLSVFSLSSLSSLLLTPCFILVHYAIFLLTLVYCLCLPLIKWV